MKRIHQLAVNDEGFVFDPTTGESFTVNATGLFIIRALKAGDSITDILGQVQDQFEVRPESAERDVTDFMSQLEGLHLV